MPNYKYSPCNPYITITLSKLPQDVIIVQQWRKPQHQCHPEHTVMAPLAVHFIYNEWGFSSFVQISKRIHGMSDHNSTKKNSDFKTQVENGNDNSFALESIQILHKSKCTKKKSIFIVQNAKNLWHGLPIWPDQHSPTNNIKSWKENQHCYCKRLPRMCLIPFWYWHCVCASFTFCCSS